MRSFFERSRARQLAEVKAILHRLQALSGDSVPGVPAVAWAKSTYPGRVTGRRALAAGLGLIAGLATIGVGTSVLHGLGEPTGLSLGLRATRSSEDFAFPTITDRQPTESGDALRDHRLQPTAKLEQSARSILEKALQDMAAGRVRAARDALIRIQHQSSADMAWTLARSYDP